MKLETVGCVCITAHRQVKQVLLFLEIFRLTVTLKGELRFYST